MAILFDNPATSPVALTTFVRDVPSPADQVLNLLLPDRVLNRNTVDLSELTRTNRTARFRAFDARLHVSERNVISSRQVKLPPLSSSLSLGEAERLQLEYTRLGGTNSNPLIEAVYDDAANLTLEVRARMEQARGDVLMDGKFTLAGEGNLTMEADFGVPGGHLVTAGTLWTTTASADIIADETSWVNTYIATNGSRPIGQVVSTRVLNLMLQNAALRTLAASLAGTPGLITRPGLDAALQQFGLPPIALVYDTNVDVDGTSTKVIADNRVIMFGADLGYTAWGVTATALELVNAAQTDFSFDDAPGIVGCVIKEGPPFRQFTYIDAVGMPVLAQPRRLFVATVA